ncbi:hypothetical protein [Pseudomonas sp. GOM6]|uniref:hypothetical protein n=1 Tax=Pseudomonas sp. GOM6 TaxID=3036944 RepID=UPI0024096B1B|nr:hypothetical protein [Pseudomonas sp. GOM6]MDG1579428.1 hypothetical protein [Pseudomonas sp. GOM6]
MNTTLTPELPNQAVVKRRRGRLQLIMLLLLAIGPMVLATFMYQWRFWVPDGRNYHGTLVGDGTQLVDIGVQGADEGRWQLLVTAPGDCAEECRQLVYAARQIHIGLNRDASRAVHGLAVARPLSDAYDQQLQREYPQLGRYRLDDMAYRQQVPSSEGAQLWIVDPHGNLVLRYDAKVKGKDILTDLRLLLKLSQIG